MNFASSAAAILFSELASTASEEPPQLPETCEPASHCGSGAARQRPDVPSAVVEAVLQHHEYLDGSGYPSGLRGEAISPLARMLTVCDIYGALVEQRSYKPAKPPAEALYVLISMAQAGKLDFRIVRSFADAIGTVLPQAEPPRRAAS